MAENGVPMLGSPHIHLIPGGSVMRAWLAILFLISSPVFATDSSGLVGNWKLVSSQVIVENEPPRDLFGPNQNGYLVLTREGRSMVLTTAGHRKGGTGDPQGNRSRLTGSAEAERI